MSLLRHNEMDSLVRRPSGINDDEWNAMIEESINLTVANQTSFFYEMALFCIKNKSKPIYENILKLFGISKATKEEFLTKTNMEHFMFRGFRHFCPEDYRNAMNHSGLKFATLEFKNGRFVWVSAMEIHVYKETEIFSLVNAKIGDKVSIVAEGLSDVDTVTLTSGSNSFQYYEKGRSKAFGDTMYMLKQAIIQNKKEALRNSTQKPNV
jgi:hypothetical protein